MSYTSPLIYYISIFSNINNVSNLFERINKNCVFRSKYSRCGPYPTLWKILVQKLFDNFSFFLTVIVKLKNMSLFFRIRMNRFKNVDPNPTLFFKMFSFMLQSFSTLKKNFFSFFKLENICIFYVSGSGPHQF